MLAEVLDLAGAVVDLVDRQLPGWEARARKRLARLEALEPTIKRDQRKQRVRIRIQALRGLLGLKGEP